MTETIAVIGATGNVGRELVGHLGRLGIVPRVLTRRPTAEWPYPVDRVVGDVADPAALGRLFTGARKAFLLATLEAPESVNVGMVEVARQAGVEQVVKLSTIGVRAEQAEGNNAIAERHRIQERALERSGLAWTFLRPGYFMSNVLRWVESIRTQGKVVAPAIDGEMAPIFPKDIAEVAALALTQEGHASKAYVLTGRELVTARQQVEILSRVLGKPLACVGLSIEAALEAARARGTPPEMLDTLKLLWTSLESHRGGMRTGTFAEITGHAPETFEQWCVANRGAF